MLRHDKATEHKVHKHMACQGWSGSHGLHKLLTSTPINTFGMKLRPRHSISVLNLGNALLANGVHTATLKSLVKAFLRLVKVMIKAKGEFNLENILEQAHVGASQISCSCSHIFGHIVLYKVQVNK